jgi:5-methylcytosine-specific restriction enzyme A
MAHTPRLPTLKHRIAPRDTRTAQPGPKITASHYNTPEHKAWAREVTRRAGGACQACGAIGKRLFADHVIELRDGGSPTDPTNGRALCGSCHTKKTADARAARQAAR